jgi:hypothetical protein
MKPNVYRLFSLLVMTVLILTACGNSTPVASTPDVAAISTAAVQTSEARFTQQALIDLATRVATEPTATPALAQDIPTPTPEAEATQSFEYKPGCVYAKFVADITVLDGTIIAPGAAFTKTWRITNAGSCKWDTRFALVFISGDKMSEAISFPLSRVVFPGQDVDVSVTLTAPTTNGKYNSQWRLSLPVGTAGVGPADENLSVAIEVSDKPQRDFAITNVVYTAIVRKPEKGCNPSGAVAATYTFYASITVNGAGDLTYQWDRSPDDGVFEGGKLKFPAAGSKQVSWTWTMTQDHPQDMERWVAIHTTHNGVDQQYDRVRFTFTCKTK